MARALRVVTVERGVDPREYALMPFGGAGPMHAAALADELEIERILCPRASGVLSALGLIASDRRRDTARTVLLSGKELDANRIRDAVAELRREVEEGLEGAEFEVAYEMRYRGQAFELAVPGPEQSPTAHAAHGRAALEIPDPANLAERFAAEHEREFGYRDDDAEVELVNIRVGAVVRGPAPRPVAAPAGRLERATRRAMFDGAWLDTEVLRGEPPAGERAEGPCVFELPEATLVLPPGWSAEVDALGTIAARREP
jgi:N-methylhydantoinase A